MIEIGLKPGDRAIFQVGTVKEIVVALFGCFKASVVPVCTLPQYREIEIGQLAHLSGAKAYFVQADFSPTFDLAAFARRMMREHPSLTTLIVTRGQPNPGEYDLSELAHRYSRKQARVRTRDLDPLPGDVALFQLSGGSTEVPKIIPRMHAEYLGSSQSWNVRHGLRDDDVSLWALPLIHNAGMLLMLVASLLGRRKLVIQSRFELDAFLRAIEQHRVTYTGSIGPIAPRIVECPDIEAYDLRTLRLLFTIARADAVEQKTGIESHHIYGITEGLLMTTAAGDPREARHNSLGWPTGSDDGVCVLKIGSRGAGGCGRNRRPLLSRRAYPARLFQCAGDQRGKLHVTRLLSRGDLVRTIRFGGRDHYIFEGRLKDNTIAVEKSLAPKRSKTSLCVTRRSMTCASWRCPIRFWARKRVPSSSQNWASRCHPLWRSANSCSNKVSPSSNCRSKSRPSAVPVARVGKVDKQALRRIIADTLAREASGEEPKVA